MRALLAAVDGRVSFGDVDEPVPGPDEALVQVRAVSINRGEALDIADSSAGSPLGWDLAGVVLRAADSGGPQPGTRVVGVPGERAWATLACVDVDRLAPIPDDVSDEDAAALPVAGLTALRLLRRLGNLRGRSVVITGASGGVGHLAVQLAATDGARVVAVSRDPSRAAALRQSGASQVVADLADLQGPVDGVLESVGGASLEHALRLVGPGGRVLTFGASSAESATLPPFWFGPRHDACLSGFTIFSDLAANAAAADLEYLLEQTRTGALRPEIGLTVDWRHADDAVCRLLDRTVAGKIVLRVGHS